MGSSLVAGIVWLIPQVNRDIFRMILVGAVTIYFLWILLIPVARVAMLVLSWPTFVVASGSLWMIGVNTKKGAIGILISYFLLQVGYTLFGSVTPRGAAIALLVVGWLGILSAFYYDRWLLTSQESRGILNDYNSKIVVVEDGTPAVAVGIIDYGATTN